MRLLRRPHATPKPSSWDAEFDASAPEAADPVKMIALRKAAKETLADYGVGDSEVAALYEGRAQSTSARRRRNAFSPTRPAIAR